MALDIVVFDSNPAGLFGRRRLPPVYRAAQAGLVSSWVAGAARVLMQKRSTAVAIGASSWESALPRMVAAARKYSTSINSIQTWGHSAPGRALLGAADELTLASLRTGHAHHDDLEKLRDVLAPEAFWWFRSCSMIAGERGQRFATVFADVMRVDVVAHTYTIGPYKSGGHAVRPGEDAAEVYSAVEGIASGTPRKPKSFKVSGPAEPNTVWATAVNPPAGWWR